MRIATGLFLSLAMLVCSGCIAVGAAVIAGVTISATHQKTAATPSASPDEVTPLTMESAAKMSRTGQVVLVDARSGAVVELPWQQGLRLSRAAQADRLSGHFATATIFREGRTLAADLRAEGGGDLLLRSRDVVELRR